MKKTITVETKVRIACFISAMILLAMLILTSCSSSNKEQELINEIQQTCGEFSHIDTVGKTIAYTYDNAFALTIEPTMQRIIGSRPKATRFDNIEDNRFVDVFEWELCNSTIKLHNQYDSTKVVSQILITSR